MESITTSKDLNLTSIIEQIREGEYQLPEFQRDYIWKDSNVKELFESVLLGHPIGSILLLELNKERPFFAWVEFSEIIPPETRHFECNESVRVPPRFLVLDGQQRLTSLSRLTNGTSEKVWYLNLKDIKDSWERHDCPESELALKEWIEGGLDIVGALSKQNVTQDPHKELKGKGRKLPLTLLSEKTKFTSALNGLRDQISTLKANKEYDLKNYKKLNLKSNKDDLQVIIKESDTWLKFLSAPISRLLDNFFSYNMPAVIVSEKIGITGVCKVFTKINTSGVSLGAFDLLVAVMYPQQIRIKQKFEEAIDKYPLIKVLDETPKRYLLQTIALMAGVSPKTASLPELIKRKHIEELWDNSCEALEEACNQIDVNCGAALRKRGDKFLVYAPLVASAACILNAFPINVGDAKVKLLRQQKLKAWYFGAGVADRYSDGTDAKQNQDIAEMSLWFSSDSFEEDTPGWLKKLWSDFNSSKNASLGKAVISMINFKEPKDFYEDKSVGPASAVPCDLHHIFPKAALREQVMARRGIQDRDKADKIIRTELSVDSVLNQTWIYSDTNRKIIADKLPSVYLREIIDQYGGGSAGKNKLVGIMQSHCINHEAVEALLKDDYETFIAERRRSVIFEFKTTGFVRHIIDEKPDDKDKE
jgi:hypothetical protein